MMDWTGIRHGVDILKLRLDDWFYFTPESGENKKFTPSFKNVWETKIKRQVYIGFNMEKCY